MIVSKLCVLPCIHVKNAFLHANLQEEVYINQQQPSYEDLGLTLIMYVKLGNSYMVHKIHMPSMRGLYNTWLILDFT